jgi:uncharacterized lipoprotein
LFADGQFVGPDTGHRFEAWANQLVTEQELAQLVAGARNDPSKPEAAWAEVNRISQSPRVVGRGQAGVSTTDMKKALAADLLNAQKTDGEAAAYHVADRELSIPKLWRAQQ